MVVARSMEVSQKKTTASFKALDGTIRTVNRETGERVTLSHKCTELDNSIPTYLGVSKREKCVLCVSYHDVSSNRFVVLRPYFSLSLTTTSSVLTMHPTQL